MAGPPVRLKFLLRERHWQTYRTFCGEYDKAARLLDPQLVGTWPSRPQLHRWLSGDLKGLPYPDHCRVLEKLFPGWSAAQLFESCPNDIDASSWLGNSRDSEEVETRQLLEAISSGLEMPNMGRALWGSPNLSEPSHRPRSVRSIPDAISDQTMGTLSETTQNIGRKLIVLGKVLRLQKEELKQLAGLAGNVVDLDLSLRIDIDRDGYAHISYRHELFNMSDRTVTRVPRELWFENTRGNLTLHATSEQERCVVIQRVHDAANLAKFACQISPPVRPGETAVVSYSCEGGQFIKGHYWRQSLPRYTRHLTINLRHRDAGRLTSCTATEEHADGSENSATEELAWDYVGKDILLTLTRDHLRPNQAVTLRWESAR